MGDNNAFSLLPQELRDLINSLCQLYCTPTWKVSGGLGRVSLLINWSSNKDDGDSDRREENADGASLPDFLPQDRDRMWDREWCEVRGATGDSLTPTSSGYEQLKDTTHLSSITGGPISSSYNLKSLPDSSSTDELNTDSDFPLDASLSSSCFSTSQPHLLLMDRNYDKLPEKTAPNTSVVKRQSGTSKAKAKMERSSFSSMPNLLSQGDSPAANGKAEGSKQKAGVKWKKALLGVLRPRKAKSGSASEKKGNHEPENVDRAKSTNHPLVKPKHSSAVSRKKSTDYVHWDDYGKTSKNHQSQEFTNHYTSKARKPFLDNRTKLDVNRRFSKVNSEDQADFSDCHSEVTVTAEVHSEYSTEPCDTPRSSVSQSVSSEKSESLEKKGCKVGSDPTADSNYNSGYTSMSSTNMDSDDVSPMDSVSVRVMHTLKVPTTVTDSKGEKTSITTDLTEMREILMGAVKEYDTQAWVRQHRLNSKGQLDMGSSKSYRRHSHAGIVHNASNTLDISKALLQRHTQRTESVNYGKDTLLKQSQTAGLRGIPHFLKNQTVLEDHDSSSYVVSEDDVEICMQGTVGKSETTGSYTAHSSEKEEPSTPESGAEKLADIGTSHIPSNFKMRVPDIEPSIENLDENMPNLELLDKFACSSEPAKSLKSRFESFWKEKLGEQFRILIVLDSKKNSKPRLQIAVVNDYKVIEQVNPAEETSSIFCMVKVTFIGQDKKYDRWLRPSELAKAAYTQKTCLF